MKDVNYTSAESFSSLDKQKTVRNENVKLVGWGDCNFP